MSDKETHSEFNSLIARYLSGELSREEIQRFEQLIEQDQEKEAHFEEMRKIWDAMDPVSDQQKYDLDMEWELLHNKLPGFQTDGVPSTKRSNRSLLFYSYRIAAVLVTGMIVAFAWLYGTRLAGTETVVADLDPVEVLLQDGTHVIVNRDSKIRYRKEFNDADRRIKLTGEAWFDVARDTTAPFVIDAGSAMVEVLGTSFNVNAYRENSSVEITVESGVVAVSSKQDQEEQIVLKAGNSGTYHKESRHLELIPSSDPNNISWKTRELFFENSSLQEVVNLVNRVYNTRLVIMNMELEACPITVTFRDQSLDAILNVLEVTMDLQITHSDGEIRLDGPGCIE